MCGRGNKGKDWWDTSKAIEEAPGEVLSGVTPGEDITGFTQSAGRQVTSDLEPGEHNPFKPMNIMTKDKWRGWYDPMFEAIVEDLSLIHI